MKKILLLCWALACLLCCAPTAQAAQAEDLSGKELVAERNGFSDVRQLFDGRTMESVKIRTSGHITLKSETGIGSVYLVFGEVYGPYTVTDVDSGKTVTFGEKGFLHEFLDLETAFGTAPVQVTIAFENGDAKLAELSAFSSGQVPSWVQRWEEPAEGCTDLALFSTHGDDEQLFFAGLLPYYAAERGYEVQVVYLTGHQNMTMRRMHEMLDGLWAVGVRHYPVFGPFGDYNSHSLAEAYQRYRQKGIDREEILSFAVENIRRFRPKVAVGHDLLGEYGHGMHMVYADVLCESVEISVNPERFPESAETYDIWEVPKTYLHLYPENRIQMDWDVPLESFGGLTAFEVTRDLGFPCHVSQQSYYSWYFKGMDTAAEIEEYSPCAFGLYRSIVGEDLEKNDFFEHLTTHTQDAEMEQQRQEEVCRKAEEEEKRQTEAEATLQTESSPPYVPEETEAPLEEGGNFFWFYGIMEKIDSFFGF